MELRYDEKVKFCAAILALSAIPALIAQTPAPAAAGTPAALANPDKVVLTIGTTKITAAQYDELVNSLPAQYQTFARGAGKRQFAEQLVQLKLLSTEAEKRKIDQQPKLQRDLAFQRENILAGAMFQSLQDSVTVDDAAVKKYYDEHKTDYETVKAKHILIRVKGAPMQAPADKPELTEEQALAKAQDIRKRLVAGEDFAKLAQAESDDSGSGAQGGDLGEFKKGMMVPPFEEAAFAAKVNEITQPVKSPFGYHVIKVEAHETKSLASAKGEIETKLRPDIARQQVDAIRKAATVQMDDTFFGPPEAPGAQPPAAR